MGKQVERAFKKNSPKPNTASHNNSSWYTDTDGFLEHSPSEGVLYYKGPALQKIILDFLGPPPLYTTLYIIKADEFLFLDMREIIPWTFLRNIKSKPVWQLLEIRVK